MDLLDISLLMQAVSSNGRGLRCKHLSSYSMWMCRVRFMKQIEYCCDILYPADLETETVEGAVINTEKLYQASDS